MNKKDRVLKVKEIEEGEEFAGFNDEFEDGDEMFDVYGREFSEEGGIPVTLTIKDETTSRVKRIPHLKNVLVFFQTTEGKESWGQLAIGNESEISHVVSFLARATVTNVARILGKNRRKN